MRSAALSASQHHPTRRLIAVIVMIMQKARDLSLRRGCLREVGEGSRVFEEFPLDFGRKSAPSHDDGRSQTFQNFPFLRLSLINLQICRRLGHPLGVHALGAHALGAHAIRNSRARVASSRYGRATLAVPPRNASGLMAYISLMVFS